jgi:transcriptional regulator with XRE-family HTH domain
MLQKMSTLSERIDECLRDSGKTLSDFAKAAAVSSAGANGWKSGESKRIRPENLFPLARYLGVNAEWLGTGKGEKHPAHLAQKTQGAHIAQSINDKHKAMMVAFDKLTPESQLALLNFLSGL